MPHAMDPARHRKTQVVGRVLVREGCAGLCLVLPGTVLPGVYEIVADPKHVALGSPVSDLSLQWIGVPGVENITAYTLDELLAKQVGIATDWEVAALEARQKTQENQE